MRPIYDTPRGITAALVSLDALDALLEERWNAGRGRGEQLTRYYLFGRVELGPDGSRGPVSGFVPADHFDDVPALLDEAELRDYLGSKGKGDESVCYSVGPASLAPARMRCAFCHQRWQIGNCTDVFWRDTHQQRDLRDFVGYTLAEVKTRMRERADADYTLMISERDCIMHDGKSREGVTASYVVQPGDSGFFSVYHYFHLACHRMELERSQVARVNDLLSRAGFVGFSLQAVPNRHSDLEKYPPWIRASIPGHGAVVIGKCKWVTNIDFSDTSFRGDLTDGDPTTHEPTYAHAHTDADLVRYLGNLRKELERTAA